MAEEVPSEDAPETAAPSPGARGSSEGGVTKMINHMQSNKVEAGLWLTRLFTIFSTIMFFFPIVGGNPGSWYQRALLSNAATSALRLHQRLPHFQFSREFLGVVTMEDSAHYLFYSLIFVMTWPLTIALAPVFLFALLHSASYTTQLANMAGVAPTSMLRRLVASIQTNQRSLLRFVAMTEIFLMPIIVISIFTGGMSILQPLVYYRFIQLRYSSRRNPYCRQLFLELRVSMEYMAAKPAVPAFLRNAIYTGMATISRFAPQAPTQQPTPQATPQATPQ